MPKFTASTQIQAPPDKVWSVVTDGKRLPEWLTPVRGVDEVDPAGPLAKGTKVEATIGNVGGARINVKEAEAGRLLKWSAGPFMAHMMRMPMSVQLELEGRGEGTSARITFKTNPMIAPIMKMMTGLNFGEEAPATMQQLKAAAEKA